MNLGLLAFNLLPIYPLDGGQILQSLLWFVLGHARSLKVVSILGLLGALGMIAAAILLHSLWIGIISLYMVMNCWTGLQQAQILSSIATPSRSLTPQSSLRGRLGEEYFEVTDPAVQSRVRARHALRIMTLQSVGFQHHTYRMEVLPPYSAISKFPIILPVTKLVAPLPESFRFFVPHAHA
jgi:hypothetical protein